MASYKRVDSGSAAAAARQRLAPMAERASAIPDQADSAAANHSPIANHTTQTTGDLLRLQRAVGNRAVGRILEQRRTLRRVSPAAGIQERGDLSRPGGIQRAVVQRAGTKLDGEIKSLVESGKYDKALSETCEKYGLGKGLSFAIYSTNDYNRHLPKGLAASGMPHGLTIGGPGRTGEPEQPTIYIHEHWIRRWVLDLDQMGNLIDTIVHELRHVRQRLDKTFGKDALDLSEFQAYAEEILITKQLTETVIEDSKSAFERAAEQAARKPAHAVPVPPLLQQIFDRDRKEKISARLPTAANIDKAYQSALGHWARMQESEQQAEQKTKDQIDAAIGAVLAFLEKHKSTSDATMLFENQVDFFGQDIYMMNRNREIPPTNTMYDKYRDAVITYNALNPADKASEKEYRAILEARWDYYRECSQRGKILDKDRAERSRGTKSGWDWKTQQWAE